MSERQVTPEAPDRTDRTADYGRPAPVYVSPTLILKSGTLFRVELFVTLGVYVATLLWVLFWLIVLVLFANLSGFKPSLPGSPAGL